MFLLCACLHKLAWNLDLLGTKNHNLFRHAAYKYSIFVVPYNVFFVFDVHYAFFLFLLHSTVHWIVMVLCLMCTVVVTYVSWTVPCTGLSNK